MGKKGVVVAAAVVALITVIAGVIAAVFMALSVTVYRSDYYGVYCKYRPSPAMPLGLVAEALTLTTQILASTAIGCGGAWRRIPSHTRRVVAILLFVASWVLAIKALILFMVGFMLGFGGYTKKLVANGSCAAPGVIIFMSATILFLIVVALDIGTYVLVQKDVPASTTTNVELHKPTGMAATGTSGAAKC